jgi:hypothetical protein
MLDLPGWLHILLAPLPCGVISQLPQFVRYEFQVLSFHGTALEHREG